MAVAYEWIVEELVDHEIEGTEYFTSYRNARSYHTTALAYGSLVRIALIRDHSSNGREWAYLDHDGRLPHVFVDATGEETRPVPRKFIDEVTRG